MTAETKEQTLARLQAEKEHAERHADACREAVKGFDPLTEGHLRWRMFRRFVAWERAACRRVSRKMTVLGHFQCK